MPITDEIVTEFILEYKRLCLKYHLQVCMRDSLQWINEITDEEVFSADMHELVKEGRGY